jgi:hypothetical protein
LQRFSINLLSFNLICLLRTSLNWFHSSINSGYPTKMESDGRMKAYCFVAYAAVTFSVVAVLSVVVTLPMVYNYVSHVRRQMHHELSFCKGSAKDISVEVYHMKSVADLPLNRTARQSGYGSDVNPAPSCEGCCLPGLPGPTGAPGKNGQPGKPGSVLLVKLVNRVIFIGAPGAPVMC